MLELCSSLKNDKEILDLKLRDKEIERAQLLEQLSEVKRTV